MSRPASRPPTASGERLRYVPPADLLTSPYQPRRTINRAELAQLAASIKAQGLLQPPTARQLADGHLELIAGHRRRDAAKLAGLATIPVRVLANVSDVEAQALTLTENLARADLSVWEEATSLAALRDARKAAGEPATGKALAALTGRSAGSVSMSLTIADAITPLLARLTKDERARVRSLSHVALYASARAQTEEQRRRLLAEYLLDEEALTPTPLLARSSHATLGDSTFEAEPEGTGRKAATPRQRRTYTLTRSRSGRLTLTVRDPDALAPDEARTLLEELAPLLRTVRARAKRP